MNCTFFGLSNFPPAPPPIDLSNYAPKKGTDIIELQKQTTDNTTILNLDRIDTGSPPEFDSSKTNAFKGVLIATATMDTADASAGDCVMWEFDGLIKNTTIVGIVNLVQTHGDTFGIIVQINFDASSGPLLIEVQGLDSNPVNWRGFLQFFSSPAN